MEAELVENARRKTVHPRPSKQPGQRSQELPAYLTRFVPIWTHPKWQQAEFWRWVVMNQPFAMICRETLISNILSLDWSIEARDSTMRDELKEDIKYYTKFFEYTGDYTFSQIIEKTGQDYFDIPFGSGVELGYRNDNPNEQLLWIEILDGATLFPTHNKKWPVGQSIKENPAYVVYFPRHAITRLYMSPRAELIREGWGMAPPEKIYLTIELLRRGDHYYANLLLDTPEAGILDLGDMEAESAKNWLKDWKDLLGGIDPYKVPVLYQHNTQAKFISFTRSPTEMMFDKATMKYAALTAAGYGMSLSDIGIQAVAASGETLAGSIRQERRTRRTGFARTKQAYKYFFDSMLPEDLEFKWIDLDDELSTAQGRAMLAYSTAANQLIDKGVFTPDEMRMQIMASGLITISIPEKMPEDERKKLIESQTQKVNERPGLLGRPLAPSSGGRGEVMNTDIITKSLNEFLDPENIYLQKVLQLATANVEPKLYANTEFVESSLLGDFWSNRYTEIPMLSEEALEVTKPTILDWIDWCEFPLDIVRSEWGEIFSKVNSDVEKKEEFLEKLNETLLESEEFMKNRIAEAVSVYVGAISLDENHHMIYDIRESLKMIYDHQVEYISNSIIELMKGYKND